MAAILDNANRERFHHPRKFCRTVLFENFLWLLKHFGESILLKDQKVTSFNVASSYIPEVYLSESLPHTRFSPSFSYRVAVRSGQFCSNHWEHLVPPFSPSGLKFFLQIGKKKIQRPGSFAGGNQAKLPPPRWTTRPFENRWLFLFV